MTYINRHGTERVPASQLVSENGAINLRDGLVVITKSDAAAVTLAAPSGNDNYKTLHIVSTTAAAHVVTAGGGAFPNSLGTATFAAFAGAQFSARAYNGTWLPVNGTGVTFS
jgi:hypothetical protein